MKPHDMGPFNYSRVPPPPLDDGGSLWKRFNKLCNVATAGNKGEMISIFQIEFHVKIVLNSFVFW